MLIAATRGALGIGLGLLLAPRFGPSPRKALGLALLSLGVLSTFPLAKEILGRKERKVSHLGEPGHEEPIFVG